MWLELLEASGATAGLWDASPPGEQRPQDGAAGWLERFLTYRQRARSWRDPSRMADLYPLVERMADRLRTELAASGAALRVIEDVDLIDLLLSLDVPVAAPRKGDALLLTQWALGEGRRDLVSLAADSRVHPAFRRGADRFTNDDQSLRAIALLAASPGGSPLLADWVRTVVRRFTAVGLPQLPEALARLKWLPAEALALAEDEVRAAVGTDLAPVLARTLRAGLFDELGWPAWEDAVASLVPKADVEDVVVADAWPHLIVAGAAQARVIGAEGTLLTHDLRIPSNGTWGDPGFHHVDGQLLVYWNDRNDGLRGYWHTRPDRPQPLEGARNTRGTRMDWYQGNGPITLPLPGGGRTTGGGVLHAGDTTLPEERQLLCDGVSYWVWSADGGAHDWHEYDPATGERGRASRPAFLADTLRDAPEGSTFGGGRLSPSPTAGATPASAPVDGLVGLRVVKLPDGSVRAQDLAGHTVALPADVGRPSTLVVFPGAEEARAVVRDSWRLSIVDADGVVTSVAKTDRAPGTFGEGSLLLPPVQYWECLTARDPEGSASLRHIDRDTAAALLSAAGQEDKDVLPEAIRSLLPVTHGALVAGIAGVVRHAGGQQAVLDAVAARLTRALDGGPQEEGPAGPPDSVLLDATNGLSGSTRSWWNRDSESDTVFRALRGMKRAARLSGTAVTEEGPAALLHLDGRRVPVGLPSLETLLDRVPALAFRAAARTTPEDHRAALQALLAEFDALGLGPAAEPSRWRKVELRLGAGVLRTPSGEWREGAWNGVLPLGGGSFIAVVGRLSQDEDGCVFAGFFHDPARRFATPEPYTLRASAPLGEDGHAARLGTFLAELSARGPAPWFPEAADEFARLTGVTETTAKLIVAGLPQIDVYERSFLTAQACAAIGVKAAAAAVAKEELHQVDPAIRAAVVAALLPAEPARLWTEGPDWAAAAEVWNSRMGRRAAVPEELLGDAVRAFKHGQWNVRQALPALLDPAGEPRLTRDREWAVDGDRVQCVDRSAAGFGGPVLLGFVGIAAWLAHRLPWRSDPRRAAHGARRRTRPAVPPRTDARPRAVHQHHRLPEDGGRADRGRQGLRAVRRRRPGHARRPALPRPAGLPARRGGPGSVPARAARRRPAPLPGGGGPASGPLRPLRGPARRSGLPAGGRAGQGRHLVAAGPQPLGAGSGDGGRQGVRPRGGRRGALPDAARHARPDGPDDGPVDGVEAGPPQGGPCRTGRHRPGGGGQPHPGRAFAVPARRLGGAEGSARSAGAVETAPVRRPAVAGGGPARRDRADRTGRGAVPKGLAAGPGGRRAPVPGVRGATGPPPLTHRRGPGGRPGPGTLRPSPHTYSPDHSPPTYLPSKEHA